MGDRVILSHKLVDSISCHSWNASGSQVALSPNNSDLHVYSVLEDKSWVQEQVLQLHDRLISGVDWCHARSRLVTCSHDLNAYVLTHRDGQWRPEMVITRLRRAALCVKWSPCGRRFAIGGAAKEVSVCFTEGENDWWGAALIRKHNSAVTAVAWHPGGELLATVSADGNCRIFNALHSEQCGSSGQAETGSKAFGITIHDISLENAWGTAVCWSPSGEQLAFSNHSSQLFVLELPDPSRAVESKNLQRLDTKALPYRDLAFLADDLLVAAGFDGQPHLYSRGHSDWNFHRKIEATLSDRPVLAERQLVSDFSAKLALFKSPIGKGAEKAGSTPSHSNAILEVQFLGGRRVSTTGLDGKIIVWEMGL